MCEWQRPFGWLRLKLFWPGKERVKQVALYPLVLVVKNFISSPLTLFSKSENKSITRRDAAIKGSELLSPHVVASLLLMPVTQISLFYGRSFVCGVSELNAHVGVQLKESLLHTLMLYF